MTEKREKYDLEERTARFGEAIIELCKKIPNTSITIPIINQLIRSGTSIGANYCEANGASSKKDFRNKIFICKKEAKETKYWLRMLLKAVEQYQSEFAKLNQEAQEMVLIFSTIAKNSQ
jgi:four helix bundle protein